MSLRTWLMEQAFADRGTSWVTPDWVEEFISAVASGDDPAGLDPSKVDQALWTISGTMSEVLSLSPFGLDQRIAAVRAAAELLRRLAAAGFGDVTAFSYFWEGFVSEASVSAEVRDALLDALRAQAALGGATQDSVMQALESMHGTPGAAGLAAELLARDDLIEADRVFLTRVLGELLLMEERLSRSRPP